MKVFEAIALPLITAYNPDVIVFELGADGLADDPLAHLYLTNNVYVEIIDHLLCFNKPILVTGGGGYNIDNTVRAWALAWCALVGADSNRESNPVDRQTNLRDKPLVVSQPQRETVTPAIEAVIEAVKAKVFSYHGL
jgi:acetoin utilization protein AcuC